MQQYMGGGLRSSERCRWLAREVFGALRKHSNQILISLGSETHSSESRERERERERERDRERGEREEGVDELTSVLTQPFPDAFASFCLCKSS
jgi:hypothetical protein